LLTPHDGHVGAADYRKLTGKKTGKYSVARFQVLMAASIKTRAFWDIAPCSLVGIYGRSRGAYCHQHPEEILERQKIKKKLSLESSGMYGARSQKTLNFILAAVRT
jgi:hypothetical protein